MRGVSKRFGATVAVQRLDLELHAGAVHALVGENGAGKSTCLGMVAGRLAPSDGEVVVAGKVLAGGDPRAARAAGVCAVYQELTIVPGLSAQANVFLGRDIARAGRLDERAMRRRYVELCEELEVAAHPDVRAGDLSVADQQMIEIMRALVVDARVLLFDEPTASLAHAEREALFGLIDRLRRQGLAVAFVSHNLDEVLDNADTVTVFRDGALVDSRAASGWSKRELVTAMLGDRDTYWPLERAAAVRRPRGGGGELALRVRGLTSPGRLEDVDLDLRKGEILGVAGLVGSGRSSLLRAIAGADRAARGTVEVGGRELALPLDLRRARAAGIALLPEDRKHQGLALRMRAADNVVLGEYGEIGRGGWLADRRLVRAAADAAAAVGFDPGRIGEPAANLSGGNQQKLLLARWRHSDHPVLLADEPTRGVDVGTKGQILDQLERIVADGRSLIVVSSELEEIVALSDRVLVLVGGRIAGALDAGRDEISVESLLGTVFAVEKER